MSVMPGAVLVLACWGVLLVLVLGWGTAASLITAGSASRRTVIRRALWFGLATGSALILVLGLVAPLASPAVAWTLIATALGGAVLAWRLWVRRSWQSSPRRTNSTTVTVFTAALVISQVVLAFAALGPVTNYDTGLYHLGAIFYASDFGIVPGLSNLYGPLGYSTLEFAWGAALTGTPLVDNGFRLLNGFLMLLLAVELWLRLHRLRRVGDYFLIVAVVVMWGPMLAMADFWIASPTQDGAALVLTLVMSAYFVDAVAGRSGWKNDAWTTVLVGVLLVAVRTTMIVYVLAALVVLGLIAIRRGYRITRLSAPAIVGTLSVLIGGAMLLRDYLLSGWLLYPLSLFPMDVPWRAEDPQGLRDATLGFHRDPTDISGALDGWQWIEGWAARLPGYWETYLVIGLSAVLIVGLVASRVRGVPLPTKPLVLSTAPAAIAVVAWFVASPPTFRFVWGPLVALLVIPIAWVLCGWRASARVTERTKGQATSVLAGAGAVILVVAAGLAMTIRIPWAAYSDRAATTGPLAVTYAFAPMPTPSTTSLQLPSGLELVQPVPTDQCWTVYPLCTPNAPQTLELRGTDVREGFAQ